MNTDVLLPWVISMGMSILGAVVALIVGLKVIGWLTRLVQRRMQGLDTDESLRSFLVSLIGIGLKILLVISIASVLGMEMTSFIAVIGAASFAVGLALQGSLANFAGGVLLLIFKPFETGDFVEAAGYSGTVQEIQVFHTILNTPDNRRVIIPNANLSNTATVNFSANPTRRLDFRFGVGYEDDIDAVKAVLAQLAEKHPLILDDPAPQVKLAEHEDSAVVFLLRAWSRREDYWTVHFDMMEEVKRAFDREGISIPYPQMDVHMQGEED